MLGAFQRMYNNSFDKCGSYCSKNIVKLSTVQQHCFILTVLH